MTVVGAALAAIIYDDGLILSAQGVWRVSSSDVGGRIRSQA